VDKQQSVASRLYPSSRRPHSVRSCYNWNVVNIVLFSVYHNGGRTSSKSESEAAGFRT